MILDQDIQYLKGVGPARAKTLAEELKIRTPGDLLRHYPYKYIDRTTFYSIRQLQEDMSYVQLRGQIIDFETEGEGRRRRLKATFTDGTGYLELVWFNGIKYVEKNYKLHTTYIILGKPTLFGRRFSIAHPEIEEAKGEQTLSQPMQPHYHTTEKMKRSGFTSKLLGELVKGVFEILGAQGVSETLPEHFTKHHQLIPLDAALHAIHFPRSAEELPAAHRRLKFEELFFLQLDILRYAHNRRMKYAGFSFAKVGECFHEFFHHHLPFSLTEAQKRVIREIRHDMGSGRQMNRLLQGDVGSGKTMVALMCCLIAIDNRFQACLMAPTEILAEQHYATVRSLLGDMNLRIALLTGSTTTAERTKTLRAIESGEINLLIGTHALIEPTVRFHNLGLAIIDEQHRFGVKQRAKLWNKNTCPPHILVMT
ncbi:MAG: DEAD/DEAH box helicase, partial [Bacteroidaceae bacterium]|nr:DEAD/DEAH box helicase [Bacteroidaceae bacterium]